MSRAFFAAVMLAAALAAPSAQAQMFGHRPPPRRSAQIDCKVIAANPNSGMDEATCEQWKQSMQTYNDAQHDPGASRPGDEDMTCDQIKAEFMAQPMQAPPSQHVTEAQSATSDYMAKQGQLQAEAAAAQAQLSAEATAASAAGYANPLAGNAADRAVDAHQQAMERQLDAQSQAELMPRARRMTSATGAIMGDVTAQMETNPRIARLVALSQEKHCHGF